MITRNNSFITLFFFFVFPVLVFLPACKTHNTTPEDASLLANCQNYGTPLNATDCKCPAYVAGRLCETIKCQRFAVPDKNRCACAPGWYGLYCGLRGCRPPNEDQLNLEKRSLIIVFNMKTTMKPQLDALKNNFKDMVSRITKNYDNATDHWIENYIVYGFVQINGVTHIQTNITDNPDVVVNFLDNMTLYDGDNTQLVLTAMTTAQQLYPQMKSHAVVLVFTDSPATDATPWSHRFTDKTQEQQVVQISLLWRSKYTFFFSLPAGTDFTSDGVDVYRRISLTNHGDTFFIQSTSDLSTALLNVTGTQYFSENVQVGYGKRGSENVTIYVDNDGDLVFILLTINPAHQTFVMPTIAGATVYAEGPSYRLYTRSSKNGDVITISSSTFTLYNYRMYIQSKNTLLFDYNDDMHIDVGNGMAVIGIGMSSTMQTYGFPKWTNSSYDVRSADGQLIRDTFYSYERPQQDCTFLYGFPVWNTLSCPPGPITQLHTFHYNGYNQQRVTSGYCIESDHNAEHPNGAIPSYLSELDQTQTEDDDHQCDQKNIDAINDPRLQEPRQFIFILEQHAGNKEVYQTLASEISQILSLINSTTIGTYENEFTLIVHDSAESHVLLSTYNPTVFEQKFHSFVNSLKVTANLDNTMGLLSIVQAQKMNIQPTAQVYYFTNQAVKNVQNISRHWDLVNRDVEVNFFTIADGITTEIFSLPKNLELIQKMTNGRLIPLRNMETTLLPLFNDLMTITALTTDNQQYNCHDSPLEMSGFFEDGAEYSVIQVIGTGLKYVKMQDSNGILIATSEYITYQNPNFISFKIGSNLFASGVWNLSTLATAGGCQITVRHKTSVGLILGFTSSINDDDVSTQIISQRSSSNSAPIYCPIKATNGIVPNNLEIQIVNREKYDQPQSYGNYTIAQRSSSSCTYNFVSNSIVVPKNELTTWTVSASASGKLTLHRIIYYYQHLPADPSVCQGGQVDTFGQCVCPPRYTGDYCWDRICQPPATYSYGICSCPPGFYGDFCEIMLVINSTTSSGTPSIETTTHKAKTRLPIFSIFATITILTFILYY